MANPGDFESWITDRRNLDAVAPKSGSSGDFETWITNRIPFPVFVEATGVVVVDLVSNGAIVLDGDSTLDAIVELSATGNVLIDGATTLE